MKNALRIKFLVSKNHADLAYFMTMCFTVKSVIRKAHKRYLLSVETILGRGDLKQFWSHPCYSRNPPNLSFLPPADSTDNSPERFCGLPCSYFSMFIHSTIVSFTALIGTLCFESLAILLSSPRLVEFLIGNPISFLVRMGFLISFLLHFPLLFRA